MNITQPIDDTLALIGNTPLVRLAGPSEAAGCDIVAFPELSAGDVRATEREEERQVARRVRQAGAQEELLQIAAQVPVTPLDITLEADRAIAQAGAPEEHVPGARLVEVDLLSARGKGGEREREEREHPGSGQMSTHRSC